MYGVFALIYDHCRIVDDPTTRVSRTLPSVTSLTKSMHSMTVHLDMRNDGTPRVEPIENRPQVATENVFPDLLARK
jgi:hypothetical protein